jgi:hypothetical protein
MPILLGPLACDDSISSSSQLRRLRLLAVQAEPPNPGLGQTTVLRPLVYLPAGESVTYEWSWCPVPTRSDDGYRCPMDQAALDTLAAQTGLAGMPALALGTAESIAFTNPFPAPLLASLCAGDSATTELFTGSDAGAENRQTYNCTVARLPVQVKLTIRGSTTDTGVFSLWLPIDASTPANQNPVITGISVVEPEPARWLDDTGVVGVPRHSEVKLRAGLDPGEAEVYLDKQLGPDDNYIKDGNGQFVLGPTQERLTLWWFVEGGGFAERSTSWSAKDLDPNGQVLPFESATDNPWTPPTLDEYARESSLVIVVVRDGRGGVAWTRGVARLEEGP